MIHSEMELKKKAAQIAEKDSELTAVKAEAADLAEQVFSLKKEVRESKENLELALGKNNSHEEENRQLKNKLKLYNAAIRKMKEDRGDPKGNSTGSDKAMENELRKQVKNKSRELGESEARCRALGQRLSELESQHKDNSASTEDKYKVVNDKLNVKTKELKKAESNLKKSEGRVKELIDKVAEKNKKISELENSNTRLKLIKEQAKEGTEMNLKKIKEKEVVSQTSKKTRCRYDNTGKCRKNSECDDLHAKKTCQSHSKLGSCPMESSCEHRHPFGICYEWERYGACSYGDACRHRHPYDLQRPTQPQPDHFLGYGSPGRQGGAVQEQGHPKQWSPGQGHHDLRGNRW